MEALAVVVIVVVAVFAFIILPSAFAAQRRTLDEHEAHEADDAIRAQDDKLAALLKEGTGGKR